MQFLVKLSKEGYRVTHNKIIILIKMCITALTIEDLDNIKTFKYKSTDSSLFYNYLLSPCLNKVVNLLPMTLSPNILTIAALCLNVLSFLITHFELYNDFEEPLSRTTCFIQFAAHLLYIILDNLDRKQARRTGSSSAYGMLLHHKPLTVHRFLLPNPYQWDWYSILPFFQ